MKPVIELLGERFGRLTVVERSLPNYRGNTRWRCACECGGENVALGRHLRTGRIRSCGCLRDEAVVKRCLKHGHARGYTWTAEYRAWRAMKARCDGTATNSRKWYADRGIRVCDEWINSFEAFLAHVGPRPSAKHSIDRIDNDGNYEPGNVRWATAKQQVHNRRPAKQH